MRPLLILVIDQNGAIYDMENQAFHPIKALLKAPRIAHCSQVIDLADGLYERGPVTT